MTMRGVVAALALSCCAVGANAAETVTLKSAWMRPAPAGMQPAHGPAAVAARTDAVRSIVMPT